MPSALGNETTYQSLDNVDDDERRPLSQVDTLVNNSRRASLDSLDLVSGRDNHEAKIKQRSSNLGLAKDFAPQDGEQDQAVSTALAVNTSLGGAPADSSTPSSDKQSEKDVTWMSLPKKGQLAVLTFARLSEPLSERSLAAYAFYQLRSFDPSLPESTITSQGGILVSAFAGAQFLTAMWWGRAADSPLFGRKKVILIGLMGGAIATVGVGFSKSFYQALFFRLLAGALNGNVGVMRTMISEMIQERKYQSRAFLLLPMCFNIGVVIGPIMGGFLADPIHQFPRVFGPDSPLGGKNGVRWMTIFPYALPNIISSVLILMSFALVVFGLDETHEALRDRPDWGRRIGQYLGMFISKKKADYKYARLSGEDDETELQITPTATRILGPSGADDIESRFQRQAHRADFRHPVADTPSTTREHLLSPSSSPPPPPPPSSSTDNIKQTDIFSDSNLKQSPSGLRAILAPNILFTLLSHHLLALHISTFNALIFLFLPTQRSPTQPDHFTLKFTGGLGLSTSKLGLATAIIGIIGFPLQILVFPPVNTKLGTLKSYRYFLPFSFFAYILIPFLVLIPSRSTVAIWTCLTFVMALQVMSRTFALPSTVILINNSAPSARVRGTIHGVAQSVSSAARMLGPILGGWGLGMGLKHNFVGGVWWGIAGVVVLNEIIIVWKIWEGDGQGGRVVD